jgi:four helix bundle protein
MRPHENLEVWKKSIATALSVYKVTESFPKEEKFGLTSQLRRAAVSIAANIAEGAARTSKKEFCHFLSNARDQRAKLRQNYSLLIDLVMSQVENMSHSVVPSMRLVE